MAVLNMLSSYSWDAKAVISIASFAVNYGEFWLVARLFTRDPLAKSVALLKQLPNMVDYSDMLKGQFNMINDLVKKALEVAKCMAELERLPPKYISDAESMTRALNYIPIAVYWIIRSLVACSSQLKHILGQISQ